VAGIADTCQDCRWCYIILQSRNLLVCGSPSLQRMEGGGNMEQIVFGSLAASPASFRKIRMLLDSLKAFGGELSGSPVVVLYPDSLDFAVENANLLKSPDVQMTPFPISREEMDFPLAVVAIGAAAAENAVAGKAENLVWLLEDTLVLRSPSALVLPAWAQYAYRPVHHTNIGSVWKAPPDDFWSAIYRHCKVEPNHLFPMDTCVRDNTIRPYFNAGCQVTRPQNGLFSRWCESFRRLYRHPDFKPFFANPLCKIFMHQAVLAGVVLSSLSPAQLHELPESYNYPLHLHGEYPPEFRPAKLNDLVTCRYETFGELQKILAFIAVDGPIRAWILSRI
jgi:hypothetical protein